MARVVVIDSAEWIASLLADALQRDGHQVTTCSTAAEGLAAACREEPACVVCATDLPEQDGYWVARELRAQPTQAAFAAFLFMTPAGDAAASVEGFKVGADAHVAKPFRVDEVVAQVDALVRMSARIREGREFLSSRPPSSIAAIEGELTQVSAPTLLSVLEIERRTGMFDVIAPGRSAVRLELVAGMVAGATMAGRAAQPLDAVRSLIASKKGRFTFTPMPVRESPEKKHSISRLLAACEGDRFSLRAPPSVPSIVPEDDPIDVEPDLDSYRPPRG